MNLKIAIIAEFNPESETHAATDAAIQHSAAHLDLSVQSAWISSEELTPCIFEEYDGIWVGPGGPHKNLEKTLETLKFARENQIPTLGTCGGFQHIVLEMARNVLGVKEAQHAEYDPYASVLFITPLTCSLKGRSMSIDISPGSKVYSYYSASPVTEKYYCNFGINPEYVDAIRNSSFAIGGSDSEGEIRILELPEHPFYLGTLFVPQINSTAGDAHPIVDAFLSAAGRVCRRLT